MKGDLHLHSYYSDGFYSPADVMKKAKDAGCEIAALTDHDTLDGIDEANEAAKALGIKNIAGVEISTYCPTEAHILGYAFDRNNPILKSLVSEQKQKRRARSDQILSRLRSHGIVFEKGCFDFYIKRELSRSHIAVAMVEHGYEPDVPTAFRKWLRSGAPTYVAMSGVEPEVAIEAIHAAGGLAVLAHPVRLDFDGYERRDFIKRLAAAHIDGIEAVYKRSSHETVKELSELAAKLGLFVTAGADYHGDHNEIIARDQNNPMGV